MKMISTKCFFCDTSEYLTIHTDAPWEVAKCKGCGYVYTRIRPSREDLPNYYAADYFKDQRHRKKFFNADGSRRIRDVSYSNRIADVEHHVSKRGNLLEIGAAKGGFLASLRERGWETDGVEISADGVREAWEDHGIELFCGELEDYTTEKRYDVICMYQTFEHVWNPASTLAKCRELLKPGGILIIEVPNRKAFEMRYSARRREMSYDLPRHLSHFTPEFLARESEKRGFQVLETDNYHAPPVLKFLGMINSIRGGSPAQESEASPVEKKEVRSIPLMRKASGTKIRILKALAKLLPGWRFTLTLRKKD